MEIGPKDFICALVIFLLANTQGLFYFVFLKVFFVILKLNHAALQNRTQQMVILEILFFIITMLAHKNINSSPVKQNISPDKLAHSPRKQINTIKQLTNLLKQHNIPISAQLLQGNKYHKPLTEFNLKECKVDNESEVKRLKVKLNDSQFQLKKLSEDFAQYKVISRLQKQKVIKKHQVEVEALKRKIQEDNTNWEKLYAQKQEYFLNEKLNLQQKTTILIRQNKAQIESLLKSQYEQILHRQQTQIDDLQRQLSSINSSVHAQTTRLLCQLQQKKSTQIDQIKSLNIQKQKQITKKLQAKVDIIQMQRRIQTQKLQQMISVAESQNQKLTNQIYYLNKEKDQLKAEIKSRDRKVLQLEMSIRAKQTVLVDARKEFEVQKEILQQKWQENIRSIQEQHNTEIKQVKNSHLDELDAYYQRINNLQQRKIAIQGQLKEQMNILQRKFSQRMSKTEDLQEIRRLKTVIALKDRQISRFQQDLKLSQRQIQNNQKNYTKIFSSHSSRRKSANSHRDKQAFFKQANTTDLKMLLKICNKDF